MKKIVKQWMMGLTTLVGLSLASCSTTPDVINTVDLDRCLSPLNFSATVADGKNVTFKWDVMQGADQFLLELYRDAEMTDLFTSKTVLAEDVPYLWTLESDLTYYARVKAQNSKGRPADSKWTMMEKKISTFEVKNALYPQIATRTATSIAVKWNKEAVDASELSHVTYAKAEPKAVKTEVKIEAAAIEAGEVEVTGLTPSTQYILTLYFKSADRGQTTGWTMPDTSGATEVSTTEALLNALSGNGTQIAEVTKIVVKYNDGVAYNLGDFVKITKPVALVGEAAAAGKLPVILGNFQLDAGATHFSAEGLSLGQRPDAGVDDQTLIRLGAKEDISLVALTNCEIYGYTKGIFYDNSKEATIAEQRYNSLLIHDIGDGQDVFDLRKGTYGSFTLENSSFYKGGRTVVRADASTTFTGDIAVKNMLFYKACSSANSNNAGILYVRGALSGTFSLTNNLFMEMGGGSTKSGLVANDANAKLPNSISNNHFFACTMAAWFTKLSQAEATTGGGSMLAADPCVKAPALNFTLKNDVLIGKFVGDPRWLANAGPLIPETLTAVDAPYVWRLSDAAYFTQGDISQSVVMGNLYFGVNDPSSPISLTKDSYVHFDKATTIAGTGVPSDHFVKFIAKGPGSVVMQPLRNDNGNGTEMISVIVDGKACGAAVVGTIEKNKQKVVLRDLPQGVETEVYLAATGVVDLVWLEWSDDVSYDPVAIKLETPVMTLSPKSIVNGTEQALDITWKGVEFTHSYELTFGEMQPISIDPATLKYTFSAATVKAMAAGKYVVKLQAKCDPADPRYKNSEIVEDTFTVEFLGTGSPVELVYPTTNVANFPFVGTVNDKGAAWQLEKNTGTADAPVATAGGIYTPAVKAGFVIDKIEIYATTSKKVLLWAKYDSKAGYSDKAIDAEVVTTANGTTTLIPNDSFTRLYLVASTNGGTQIQRMKVYYKAPAPNPDAPLSYEWDFTSAATFAGGDFTADKVFGDLTILATETNKVTIEEGKRIKLNGKSALAEDGVTPISRALKFKVNSNGTLTVNCASSSGSDATRELWISIGGVATKVGTAPTAAGDMTIDVTGVTGEQNLYVFCKVNAINLISTKWEGKK